MDKAHDIHVQAETAREKEQFIESLKLYEEAILTYQQEKNNAGIAEALQGKFLTYKHLYLLTHNESYLTLCFFSAAASLEIIQENDIHELKGSISFRLGEIEMLRKEYQNAADYYQNAIDNHHGIKAEIGDYRYHLGEALFLHGSKEAGKTLMLKGLKEIQDNREGADPFLIHTWESGCYMKLAYLLRDEKAKEYMQKAKEIIDSDPKLIIRKRQYEELAAQLTLG